MVVVALTAGVSVCVWEFAEMSVVPVFSVVVAEAVYTVPDAVCSVVEAPKLAEPLYVVLPRANFW